MPNSVRCYAAKTASPGGGGAGSGLPLTARIASPGGGGAGRGLPLERTALSPGGGGAGSGLPLTARIASPGGGGAGRGLPLKDKTEVARTRLLDKCLTELTTGSTIKAAKPNRAKQIELFFFTLESLLNANVEANR